MLCFDSPRHRVRSGPRFVQFMLFCEVESGAQVLDFNFDTDLLDGVTAMGKFMRLCVTDPLISKVQGFLYTRFSSIAPKLCASARAPLTLSKADVRSRS